MRAPPRGLSSNVLAGLLFLRNMQEHLTVFRLIEPGAKIKCKLHAVSKSHELESTEL